MVLSHLWELHLAYQGPSQSQVLSSMPYIKKEASIRVQTTVYTFHVQKKNQPKKSTNRMVAGIPVTNQKNNIPLWLIKRNWNNFPVINNNRTKTTRHSLKIERWEVEKASNLILDLKLICPIPLRRDWTICSLDTILPWVTPHLNPRPANASIIIFAKINYPRKGRKCIQLNLKLVLIKIIYIRNFG